MTDTEPALVARPSGLEWAGSYRLPNNVRSPRLARTLVRQAMLGCPPDKVEAAELLVTELVTNAIRHAETDTLLTIVLEPGIRISVEDGSSDPVRESESAGEDETGRGLGIVRAVATSWGWDWTRCGKQTWFEL